ncbi:hypothetical protein DM01DRAFT_1336289 [Hesseltinella vesiculosa]|uniref:Uncharacterized protein n=1 Tax=Hesseltinella vesiculosa TaxID=101127 RepID=A0A1X2GG56_9FUNG|nr:hypothetical protein DM01DRAFT_1336289 [Hesseltinella vesiculosa]
MDIGNLSNIFQKQGTQPSDEPVDRSTETAPAQANDGSDQTLEQILNTIGDYDGGSAETNNTNDDDDSDDDESKPTSKGPSK